MRNRVGLSTGLLAWNVGNARQRDVIDRIGERHCVVALRTYTWSVATYAGEVFRTADVASELKQCIQRVLPH